MLWQHTSCALPRYAYFCQMPPWSPLYERTWLTNFQLIAPAEMQILGTLAINSFLRKCVEESLVAVMAQDLNKHDVQSRRGLCRIDKVKNLLFLRSVLAMKLLQVHRSMNS